MEFYVDLSGVTTPAALHRQLQETLPCPGWYGGNLDAFYDLLSEFGSGWQIILLHPEELEDSVPGYAAALYRLCLQAMEDIPGLRITVARD